MGDGIKGERLTVESTLDVESKSETIGYRRLRSPASHGQTLQFPPLQHVDRLWKSNLESQVAGAAQELGASALVDLQRMAREEMVELASSYSGSYLDSAQDVSTNQIVMAGHQPELFHPGVWYKNFVLSNLGQRFQCTAINLVVDNDICGSASIRFPKVSEGLSGDKQVTVGTIPVDRSGPNVAFESREIQDWEFFEQFRERAEHAINKQVQNPIVARLWPHVIEAAERFSLSHQQRLGSLIAAGRHRLESEAGLQTLEVPVSHLAETKSFSNFASLILLELDRFRAQYNTALMEYRTVHGIRSRSHPVPELETIDGWVEAPFWVWHADPTNGTGQRQRLFAKPTGSCIMLSDRAGWESKIELSSFAEQFGALGNSGVLIRPRALMTTMFARLLLCDLFLHGIGGSKYDQLTDVIATRFFGIQLPGFLTLTATMKLPTDVELVRRSDLTAISQQIRDLKFHPELHISNPSTEVNELITQKRNWTIGEHRGERSRQKHVAINDLNDQLSKYVDVNVAALEAARIEAAKKTRATEILDSREHSFCLFPESLIDELKAIAVVEN